VKRILLQLDTEEHPSPFDAIVARHGGDIIVAVNRVAVKDLGDFASQLRGRGQIRVRGRAEALTGPTTPPGKRVQTINPPGSEVGPGQVATWGRSDDASGEGFGFKWTAKE
jgi:hypothetical protein